MPEATPMKCLMKKMSENWNLWPKKTQPNLIISILNSNIQNETNKILYSEGLVKAAMDARE